MKNTRRYRSLFILLFCIVQPAKAQVLYGTYQSKDSLPLKNGGLAFNAILTIEKNGGFHYYCQTSMVRVAPVDIKGKWELKKNKLVLDVPGTLSDTRVVSFRIKKDKLFLVAEQDGNGNPPKYRKFMGTAYRFINE